MLTAQKYFLGFVGLAGIAAVTIALTSGRNGMSESPKQETAESKAAGASTAKLETATFGGGCFWCVEAVLLQLKGVEKVVSGYEGGKVENPTYEQVCTGFTGHAEVVEVTYDPSKVSFADLLEVFWKTHDPTTLNRQGNDIGTQYRSVIFYHNDKQKEEAEHYKKKLDEAKAFDNPIVTQIVPAEKFYAAENYHQNYYNDNKQQGYCRAIIGPKVEKVRKVFKDKLKGEEEEK